MIYNECKLKERLDKTKIEISPKDIRVEDVSFVLFFMFS